MASDRKIALTFDTLGLTPALLRAVGDMGLYAPTPIQAEAIPAALKLADVWATAPTGSGKTLAFALPLLQHLLAAPRQTNFRRPVRVLVLVPTRELAVQVGDVLANLAYKLPQSLKVNTVFGGVSVNPQMMALRGGADIVVGTPGRLLDLWRRKSLKLDQTRIAVLDEAVGDDYRVFGKVRIADVVQTARAGETLRYRCDRPHSVRCTGKEPGRATMVCILKAAVME